MCSPQVLTWDDLQHIRWAIRSRFQDGSEPDRGLAQFLQEKRNCRYPGNRHSPISCGPAAGPVTSWALLSAALSSCRSGCSPGSSAFSYRSKRIAVPLFTALLLRQNKTPKPMASRDMRITLILMPAFAPAERWLEPADIFVYGSSWPEVYSTTIGAT